MSVALLNNCQDFYTQQGEWMHIFLTPLPRAVSDKDLEKSNGAFSVSDVKEWVEKHRSMHGRFQFFETFAANNEFYLKVAEPLLSIGTVGSMCVERRVKPIKHTIMTKKRNRLGDSKGIVLFRVHENLNHVMKAKKILGKSITDSLV